MFTIHLGWTKGRLTRMKFTDDLELGLGAIPVLDRESRGSALQSIAPILDGIGIGEFVFFEGQGLGVAYRLSVRPSPDPV